MDALGPTSSGWQTIKVDSEVWAAINADAKPFVDREPNDVLRRHFVTEAELNLPSSTALTPSRRPGALSGAIQKGTLKPGDILICDQPRKKRLSRARVTDDGWIATIDPDKGEFSKPSPALAARTGSPINGWGNWKVERTDEYLEKYRY